MFNRRNLSQIVANGFKETLEKKQLFETEYKQTTQRINEMREKITEESGKRGLIQNR